MWEMFPYCCDRLKSSTTQEVDTDWMIKATFPSYC